MVHIIATGFATEKKASNLDDDDSKNGELYREHMRRDCNITFQSRNRVVGEQLKSRYLKEEKGKAHHSKMTKPSLCERIINNFGLLERL